MEIIIIFVEAPTEWKQILIDDWQVVSIDLSSEPSIFTHVLISVSQHQIHSPHWLSEESQKEEEKKKKTEHNSTEIDFHRVKSETRFVSRSIFDPEKVFTAQCQWQMLTKYKISYTNSGEEGTPWHKQRTTSTTMEIVRQAAATIQIEFSLFLHP